MISAKTMQHLEDAKSQLGEAKRQYAEAVRAAFPIGSTAICTRNGRVMVEILAHGYLGRVVIKSETGAHYAVDENHLTPTAVSNGDSNEP